MSAEAFVLATLRTSAQAASHAVRTKLVGRRVELDRRHAPSKPSRPSASVPRPALSSCKKRRSLRKLAVESVGYEELLRQHKMWMEYARQQLLGVSGVERLAQILLQLDRHGCWLRVASKGSGGRAQEGIVLLETRNTFILVSKHRRLQILKANSVFEMLLPCDGEPAFVSLDGKQLVA
ncbi:MAG: hypothetical protein SGPRY_013551 [Prymnesium sp.]